MERLEAAGRLAAWMAHQINNPLGAISGNAQLLSRRLQRDISDPDALKSYLRHLEAIQSQTERCAGIVSEVLSFTEPREPECVKLDLRDAVEEAVSLVQYGWPESRITLDESILDLPPVRADREWLVRVVFELLSNAVEAAPGEIITVDLGSLQGKVGQPAMAQVRVIDSGSGMADDVLPRVFDPFFSTREKAKGLGLTLSLEMMRKMKGTLSVERSGENGSVFVVGIPLWRQPT